MEKMKNGSVGEPRPKLFLALNGVVQLPAAQR
jgi:hypothetical protein